jgi:hypothetical protein
MVAMRRVSAILLMAMFSFSLIVPAFSVDSESNLPACCRRSGAHHCAMASGMGHASSSGPAFAAGSTCPYFPASLVTTIDPALFLGLIGLAIFAALVVESAVQLLTRAHLSKSHGRSHLKRGPPLSPAFA